MINLALVEHVSYVQGVALVFYYEILNRGIAVFSRGAKIEVKQGTNAYNTTEDIDTIRRETAPGDYIKVIIVGPDIFNKLVGQVQDILTKFQIPLCRV